MKKSAVLFIISCLYFSTPDLNAQTILNDFDGNFRSKGWIKTDNGSYYFGNTMRLHGNDASAFFLRSNDSNISQMYFRDKENQTLGKIVGSGDGLNFGLTDGDGHWSIRTVKDTYTSFLIDNSEKLRILSSGNIGIGLTNPQNTLHVDGTVRVADKSFFGNVADDGDANYNVYSEKGILATGALRTDAKLIYFGPEQRLDGDGGSQLTVTSNHSTATQMAFRDKENVLYGKIHGNGDGVNFGLMDGDSNWSILAAKDDYTSFRIDQSEKLRILSNGNIGVGISVPTNTLHVNGTSRVVGKSFFGAVTDDGDADFNVYSEKGILAKGALRTDDKHVYFGNDIQYVYAVNEAAFQFRSDHSESIQLVFKDKENQTHGRISGANDGEDFGLLDGDGNWALRLAKDNYTSFRIDNVERMRINLNGNVGIGTQDPVHKLHVNGATRITGKTYIGNVDTELSNNNYRLFVEKGILTEAVRVAVKNSSDWADFVFEDDHKLVPLNEVNQFISKNKHLPNVPSVDQVVEEGIDIAKMDAILLRQIEELWLHLIELKEENVELKKEMKELKNSF